MSLQKATTGSITGRGRATEKNGYLRQHMYSASVGARYYLKRFFVGSAFGLAYERNRIKIDGYLEGFPNGRYGFYRHHYIGYQLPLNSNHHLEFIGGVFGASSLKVGGGVRYKIGF